jgi:hypothetical protein
MHVDDLLIAGHGTKFQSYIQAIKSLFEFRTWKSDSEGDLEYCGGIIRRGKDGTIELSYADFIRKVKPITLRKEAKDSWQATPTEIRLLRGLIGALQWPATQCCPHLACSVSMLAAYVSDCKVSHLKEANKCLRFAKNHASVTQKFYRYPDVKSWIELGFLSCTDAAWATRPDGSSQGGHLVLAVPPRAFKDESVHYGILEWKSYKLPRVARSSLHAETQAAAEGADALEFCKVFWSLCRTPWADVRDDEHRSTGPSALVVDAKSLYDALQRESTVSGAACKRSAVEQVALKQALGYCAAVVRWVSSERQLADGLTKVAGRELMAQRLANQSYRLVYDATFTAAKKKTAAERNSNEK